MVLTFIASLAVMKVVITKALPSVLDVSLWSFISNINLRCAISLWLNQVSLLRHLSDAKWNAPALSGLLQQTLQLLQVLFYSCYRCCKLYSYYRCCWLYSHGYTNEFNTLTEHIKIMRPLWDVASYVYWK